MKAKSFQKQFIYLTIFFLLSSLFIQSIAADKNIIYVDDDGEAAYTRIQDAIDAANQGDIVFVYPGYYVGRVEIDKSINVIGANKLDTIIDKSQRDDVVKITADHVNFSGFTVVGSTPLYASCCLINAHFCSVTNNIFMNGTGGGVHLWSSTNNTIKNNIITHVEQSGIFIGGCNNTICENIIKNNTYEYFYGIHIGVGTINNNMIYHNSLINNWKNTLCNDDEINYWYNDSIQEGNYWHDYDGFDNNSDGIGDTPYDIDGGLYQDMYPLMDPFYTDEEIFLNQSVFDRGFPIRHAVDGDWAGAQHFIPTVDTISKVELYARVFGTPEFDLTVELRMHSPEGILIDSVSFEPTEVSSDWSWLTVDFTNTTVVEGVEYYIVCPPAPSGVTSSFGYEWGYAFGDQYTDGSFWFTRDGGSLWRDLPTMYEFSFQTFGYN